MENNELCDYFLNNGIGYTNKETYEEEKRILNTYFKDKITLRGINKLYDEEGINLCIIVSDDYGHCYQIDRNGGVTSNLDNILLATYAYVDVDYIPEDYTLYICTNFEKLEQDRDLNLYSTSLDSIPRMIFSSQEDINIYKED